MFHLFYFKQEKEIMGVVHTYLRVKYAMNKSGWILLCYLTHCQLKQ